MLYLLIAFLIFLFLLLGSMAVQLLRIERSMERLSERVESAVIRNLE